MTISHGPRSKARRVVPALLLAALTAVTGCSSSPSKAVSAATSAASAVESAAGSAAATVTASPSASASASTSAGTSAGTSVTVTEKEYSVTPAQTKLTAGTYTFVAENTGAVVHALAVAGPGVTTVQTDSISPGQQAQLTATLRPGDYELWCPIDGHKGLGMDTHIQVAAGTS